MPTLVRSVATLDHPRIRGEHVNFGTTSQPMNGIIPAYAGSTPRLPKSAATERGSSPHTRGALFRSVAYRFAGLDHPRIRGEHSVAAKSECSKRWDHPRIRGEHAEHLGLRINLVGIIPAYAGSTGCRGF